MKIYVVGGAVRDRLLGLPVSDRDHVVVGATIDDMLAQGFKPVGRDFPVFLHPVTHEEYALARTERKVAPGYAGFVFHADPQVTLEEDLARRDLSINAIAEDETTGTIVDPFSGRADLERRVFRHVSAAFVEDPVRILRVARFAARFTDFTIDPETLALMRTMVANGEVDALVPERVWQELARGLMERRPSRMIETLTESRAWSRLFPRVDLGREALTALDRSAEKGLGIDARFAVMMSATRDRTIESSLGAASAAPRSARDLARLLCDEGPTLAEAGRHAPLPSSADPITLAMERADAFRRPGRFGEVLAALGATMEDDAAARLIERLGAALGTARAVDAGAIAREEQFDAARIGLRLHAARLAAVTAALAPASSARHAGA